MATWLNFIYPCCLAADQHVAELEAELRNGCSEAQSFKGKVDEAAELLQKEQETCKAGQSSVIIVEGDLGNHTQEYESLKAEHDTLATNFKQLNLDLKHTKIQMDNAQEELKQAMEIVSGKPYLLHCIFEAQA